MLVGLLFVVAQKVSVSAGGTASAETSNQWVLQAPDRKGWPVRMFVGTAPGTHLIAGVATEEADDSKLPLIALMMIRQRQSTCCR